jgi:chloramphenicol 3-O phosphotransferase
MAESHGQIIILNGTSSSGKSSIAKELQRTLPGYTLHTGIDHFSQTLPEGFFVTSDGIDPASVDGLLWVTASDGTRVTEMRLGPKAVHFKESMYRSARAMAASGFNVVVDDVIIDDRVLEIACQLLGDVAYFVGVCCPRDEAIRRESARGDRPPGFVETQFDLVHRHGRYDLTVDTHASSPSACADAVHGLLAKTPRPSALRSLAGLRTHDGGRG